MQLVRGTIGDQPWGWTFGAPGLSRRNAQLVLRAEDKEYRVSFEAGLVVAASSPMTADSVTRVALTNHLIAPVQVKEINRHLAAAPNLDEVAVLAAAAHLDPEATTTLRARLLTQRAARTFSVDRGDFEIEELEPGVTTRQGVDVRAAIFMGARMNLSEDRLRFGLRRFAQRFVLKPGIHDTLAGFGFTSKEHPLLHTLQSPTSLPELEANHRGIDPRTIQAVIYALAACAALVELDLDGSEVDITPTIPTSRESDLSIPIAPPAPATPPAMPRAATGTLAPGEVVTERVRQTQSRVRVPDPSAYDELELAQGTPGVEEPVAKSTVADEYEEETRTFEGPLTKAITSLELEDMLKLPAVEPFDGPPTVARSGIPKAILDGVTSGAARPRSMIETFKTGRVTSIRPNALKAHEIVALIKERRQLIKSGADHFTLLGLPVGAPIEDIHAAYVELQRNLDAKRLRELNIVDKGLVAEGILAQVTIAFTVLTDRIRRTEYIATLAPRIAKPTPRSR